MLADANFKDIETPEIQEIQFYVEINKELRITQLWS